MAATENLDVRIRLFHFWFEPKCRDYHMPQPEGEDNLEVRIEKKASHISCYLISIYTTYIQSNSLVTLMFYTPINNNIDAKPQGPTPVQLVPIPIFPN